MVKQMRPGSVIVDVAVDQGGVIETADRVITHKQFRKNMACSTMPVPIFQGLSLVTLLSPLPMWPFLMLNPNNGFTRQLTSTSLRQRVTTYQGHITSQPVATGLERDFTPIDEWFKLSYI